MSESRAVGIGLAILWFAFPIVPVLLARTFYESLNFGGLDPRCWDLDRFALLLGPLWGYGFLAGATTLLPNGPERKWGFRGLLGHRATWVAVGPWIGFLFWAGLYFLGVGVSRLNLNLQLSVEMPESVSEWIGWGFYWLIMLTLPYAWIALVVLVLRRACQVGRLWPSIRRGVLTALIFVGSLVGGFWAATEVWRSYFFDPRVISILILGVVLLPGAVGCAQQETVGDIRRRELFEAMLLAWVLGLALIWRWWSRTGERG